MMFPPGVNVRVDASEYKGLIGVVVQELEGDRSYVIGREPPFTNYRFEFPNSILTEVRLVQRWEPVERDR